MLSPQIYAIAGLGTLLLIGGAGYIGYQKGEEVGENRIQVQWQQDLLEKTQAIETARMTIDNLQEAVSNNVSVRYVDRVKTVTETVVENQDVIREVFKDSPFITQGWVYAHDQLVEGEPINYELASNLEPSEYTYMDALQVVGRNYGVAIEGKIRNEEWNNFYSGVVNSYDGYRLPEPDGTASDSSSTATSPERTYGPPAGIGED